MKKQIDFTKMPFNETFTAPTIPPNLVDLEKHDWKTLEQIDVKPLYDSKDTNGLEHLGFVSGIAPFFRGPYPAMYKINLGRFVSMQVFLLRKKVMHFTAET